MNIFELKYAVATLAVTLVLSGCSALPSKHIYTEIDIAAPPEVVWEILTDNERYGEWNPYHVRVEGELKVGKQLYVEIRKPNGEQVEIEPHVMRMQTNRELTWGGGVRGIFFGEHRFLLEQKADDQTKLVHRETFAGVAIPFASLDAIQEGYELMNRALKARAEAGAL